MIHIFETPYLKLNLCSICRIQCAAIVFSVCPDTFIQHSGLNNSNYSILSMSVSIQILYLHFVSINCQFDCLKTLKLFFPYKCQFIENSSYSFNCANIRWIYCIIQISLRWLYWKDKKNIFCGLSNKFSIKKLQGSYLTCTSPSAKQKLSDSNNENSEMQGIFTTISGPRLYSSLLSTCTVVSQVACVKMRQKDTKRCANRHICKSLCACIYIDYFVEKNKTKNLTVLCL